MSGRKTERERCPRRCFFCGAGRLVAKFAGAHHRLRIAGPASRLAALRPKSVNFRLKFRIEGALLFKLGECVRQAGLNALGFLGNASNLVHKFGLSAFRFFYGLSGGFQFFQFSLSRLLLTFKPGGVFDDQLRNALGYRLQGNFFTIFRGHHMRDVSFVKQPTECNDGIVSGDLLFIPLWRVENHVHSLPIRERKLHNDIGERAGLSRLAYNG